MSDDAIKLAYRLFRRHHIDRVEFARMNAAAAETGDKLGKLNRHYDRFDHELFESDLETMWAADGKTRAYWYLLARAALAYIAGEQPDPLPKRLKCQSCNNQGRYLKSKWADHFSLCDCGCPVLPVPGNLPVLDDGWHKDSTPGPTYAEKARRK